MKQERFFPREIIRDQDAEVKHFTREGQRDRFGNRLFTSRDLAYPDGSGERVKAGLLISSEGENFIKRQRGILKDISWGLSQIETPGKGTPERFIDLGGGRTLEAITTGGQSNFYILSVNGEKYAIKTHAPPRKGHEEIHQPYVNEMLQSQTVALDLARDLAALKIRMPDFLFASGQVSCSRYEADTGRQEVHMADLLDKLNNLEALMLPYIVKREDSGDPLWRNADVDIPTRLEDRMATVVQNFRIRSNGTLVWIDPFVYYRPDRASEGETAQEEDLSF